MAFIDDRTSTGSAEQLFDLFDSVIGNDFEEKNLILPVLRKFSKNAEFNLVKGNS